METDEAEAEGEKRLRTRKRRCGRSGEREGIARVGWLVEIGFVGNLPNLNERKESGKTKEADDGFVVDAVEV